MASLFKRINAVAAAAGACLAVWAIMVALVLAASAAQRREAPDRQYMNWQGRLTELGAKHSGLGGWDVGAELERFFAERERPYTHLAVLTPAGDVVASYPRGWEGRNASQIAIGDATLWELTLPPAGPPNYAYARVRTEVRYPYSSLYVVGDTLWLWPGGAQPSGRIVAIRPAFVMGKPFWARQGAHALVRRFILTGYLAFLAYWVLVAVWMYRDARRRDERALAWGLLGLATNLVGLSVYLMVRRSGLQAPCRRCARPLDAAWHYCPHCGTAQTAV